MTVKKSGEAYISMLCLYGRLEPMPEERNRHLSNNMMRCTKCVLCFSCACQLIMVRDCKACHLIFSLHDCISKKDSQVIHMT